MIPLQIEASAKLTALLLPVAVLGWLFLLRGVREGRFYAMAKTTKGQFVGRRRPIPYFALFALNAAGTAGLTVCTLHCAVGIFGIDGAQHLPRWLLIASAVLAPTAGLPSVLSGLIGLLYAHRGNR